ncbi:tRNA (adenosine(37)-N6)-threonylcarbamoyltransferase complex dimerization subunit type 1 TsaB [Kyrpidia sp.]|uniref:tRNA (adenosine(37)-N6)-threonylcarbamoyltransferase complex dimerization subunit type 1 TsaB n=1 Tax=Kyrpidia sp. TaxID=2073077 RepID=UPI00258E51ED|nr:tRNA (adenosine(37)-N6)-threonylcarbamoyltransferase complex dimerization subunit type 1 TsaB [Kyrpidia sp.]MCL6575274.1 tRNA (adenosine(37)-N6)-threonylcarbamoyltransferase complex dimerization subunit type 1 TsaB [Kyrpidia sp.]
MVRLAIDTATAALSMAVEESGSILAEAVLQLGRDHSVHVLPWLERVLAGAGKGPADLNRVVVGVGPGSYTGVRVGVTVAKTLGWALGIPVVPVSTLSGLAGRGRFFDGVVVPMVDARRDRVYAAWFSGGREGGVVRESPDQVWPVAELAERLAEDGRRVLALGDGGMRYASIWRERLGGRLRLASPDQFGVRAADLLAADEAAGDQGSLLGHAVHGLVPQYLQLAEAEARWRDRQH